MGGLSDAKGHYLGPLTPAQQDQHVQEAYFSRNQKAARSGSERHPVGTRVGDQPDNETIEISVILKPKMRASAPRSGGATVTREEFAAMHGADASAIDKVKQFAKENNLTVGEVSPERRTVKLEGTAGDMRKAFEVTLDRYEHEGQQYRARTGWIKLPSDLAASVEAVVGLDTRPQAKPHFRVHAAKTGQAVAAVAATPFLILPGSMPAQLVISFRWTADGTGETVGILELGGGYKTCGPEEPFCFFRELRSSNVISVLVDKA